MTHNARATGVSSVRPSEQILPTLDEGPLTTYERDALARAFDLARLGPAHGPNPRVGCVLLADVGAELASGFHRGAGTPHAEADALANAAAAGIDPRGATAVVTLEPCNHTGRTGPCSEALLAAGVRRVVFAVGDPNPVASGGAQRLRTAGIDVVGPPASPPRPVAPDRAGSELSGQGDAEASDSPWAAIVEEGRELVRAWLTAAERGRPFVTLKTASTLDGRVAAVDGSSRWITSPESRAHAHAWRAQVDAIVVGTGTALTDDPSLTARDATGHLAAHQPLRVVVGHRDLPANAALHGDGGELVTMRTHDPLEVLAELHAREVRHVLVEGGPTLAAAFVRAGLIDELHAYVAPVLLGAGAPAVGDLSIGSIAEASRWQTREVHRLGPDVLVVATALEQTASAPTPPSNPGLPESHPAGTVPPDKES